MTVSVVPQLVISGRLITIERAAQFSVREDKFTAGNLSPRHQTSALIERNLACCDFHLSLKRTWLKW